MSSVSKSNLIVKTNMTSNSNTITSPVGRNLSIDLGRWIFAFLIVTIHLNIFAKDIFLPIARCAVPFFYMVTGYYIANQTSGMIAKSALKWFWMWIKYFVIIAIAVCLIEHSIPQFCLSDLKELICMGSITRLSVHTVCGYTCDVVSPLWFLYSGAIALILIALLRRTCRNHRFEYILSMLVFSVPAMAYFAHVENQYPFRLFTTSIPFLSIGMVMRNHKVKDWAVFNTMRYCILLFVMILFLEYFLLREYRTTQCEIFICTIPLSIMLFSYFLVMKLPEKLGGGISLLPVRTTMDVYVWHCFTAYVLLKLDINFYWLTAIVVFVLVSSLSVLTRKIIHRYL